MTSSRLSQSPWRLLAIAILVGAPVGLARQAAAQPYTETVIHKFVSNGYIQYPYAPLLQASDGDLYGTTFFGGVSGWGSVFRVSNLTGTPTTSVIYSFSGEADGANPYAELIQASDGNLYGTTSNGGAGNAGTVFKITNLAGTPAETVIYSFAGSDGAYPQAALLQASDGSLYGTTAAGGTNGHGTVFKIINFSGSPVESVVYSFSGGTDGGQPQAALIQGSDGNLYGTTNQGGSGTFGTVFSISNLGGTPSESVIHSFLGGSADGSSPQAAVLEALDGNLYGTTKSGGTGNFGTVFRISDLAGTPTENAIVIFSGGANGGYPDSALIQASDGNLYGTAGTGGSGVCGNCGIVFSVVNLASAPGETVIHSFANGADGSFPTAAVLQASDGNLYGTTIGGGGSLNGTVFKISSLAGTPSESVVYSFPSFADGSYPLAPLIQVSDGNLYGTTYSGGVQTASGTVFQIGNLAGTPAESVIHSFICCTDGSLPLASVLQASNGDLYGTTFRGGTSNWGTVFKIDNLAGVPAETVIYSFTGGADGGGLYGSLIQASDGNLYGTTGGGGATGNGVVFKISNLGGTPVERVIYSFSGGPADGANPAAALIQASDGNLYGTTANGGTTGWGTVFKIGSLAGTPTESVVYSFSAGADGANPYAPLIQASDGNLYGTTSKGGAGGAGTVFEISNLGGVPTETVIHSFSDSDGNGPYAAVVEASDGDLYGTTEIGGANGDGVVFVISNLSGTPTESVVYTFTGNSDGQFPVSSLIQATDRMLYGTAQQGGDGNGIVFRISGGCLHPVQLSPSALAAGTVNAFYSQSVTGSGGTAPYSYTVTSGSLPAGLALNSSTGTISGTPTAVGASTFAITATDVNGCSAAPSYTITVNAAAVHFYTITPCRLIDTRGPAGVYGSPVLQGNGTQRSFSIDGQCGIPANAVAVSANVTVVGPTGKGDLRLFPAGTPTPNVSSINFNAGQTRAGNAVLPLVGSPVGSLTVQCDVPSGSTNLVLDVNGYFQ